MRADRVRVEATRRHLWAAVGRVRRLAATVWGSDGTRITVVASRLREWTREGGHARKRTSSLAIETWTSALASVDSLERKLMCCSRMKASESM